MREHFIEECEKRGIQLHILVGNHDIPYRNTNDINAIRETFARYETISLYWDPTELNIDGCRVLMMPWINSSNQTECFDIINKTKAQVMFAHLEIKGFEMYRGMPSHEGYDPNMFQKFDVVASGHFHKKSQRDNIHYLGAPYQMTWSDYDCPRGFHIFDTSSREFEYVINPLHMFHKIWYNDTDKTFDEVMSKDFSYLKNTYVKAIVQQKSNPYWFDLWLNKVYESQPLEVSIVDDHKNMDSISDEDIINNAEDTLTILSTYVKHVESNRINKDDLDKLMRDLYNEAINTEVAEAE